jgi:acyl-CoA synthetase (AMP-forming)/AMP-acid ligase II
MGIPNLLNAVKQVKPEAMVSISMVHWLRRFKKDYFKNVKVKISLGAVGGSTHHLYTDLNIESREFTPHEVSMSDSSAILFTSGGTGIPKGVVYTHGILNAQTDALRTMFSLDESKVDLPGFPLFALFTLAMGMTSVVPELDPTRPAQCNPKKIVKNITEHKATFVAGSPAIWERVGKYCLENKIKLSSVKQVVMFGAPVRAEIHQMYKNILTEGDTFTPYGATECLPVCLISGTEVLKVHLPMMMKGFGTCIGPAVPGINIKIIKTSDIPVNELQILGPAMIGEIAVSGKQVTPHYFEMPEETRRAKIVQDDVLWHRMGDIGWLDEQGNLWFLGRKVHRVETEKSTYYSIQMEAIFNQHPKIKRSALVKINEGASVVPGLVIQRHDGQKNMTDAFMRELLVLKESAEFTKDLKHFFLHDSFPVDVRHNIKIDRLQLSRWAQDQLSHS